MTPLQQAVLAAKPILIPAEEQCMRIQDANWKNVEDALRAALLALADSACPRELLMPLGLTPRHWTVVQATLRAIAEGK